MLVRPGAQPGDPGVVTTFASGLRNPHDVVFHNINGTTYVYVAESHQINRYIYNFGDTTAHDREIIITGLPDASSPELGGSYGHQLKNIALDSNHKLYLSIASVSNASPSDAFSDPVRCAIYLYDADGTNRRLYARGLRNAEGLAMLPNTNELWVVVNNRDNIAYPFHNDWNGDGSDDYGKVMSSYVDNHPPEEFTRVRDGGNYGWPFANPNPDTASGYNNMPFDLDVQNNADGRYGTADSFDRITKGIQAHSAPLGISFLQNTAFPELYRNGVVVGLHGSWNRTVRTGYKIAYFPWDSNSQVPGDQIDLVTGWLSGGSVWGRPVDAIADLQGNLLISDDSSGTIYKLTYKPTTPPPPAQRVDNFVLYNADTDQPVAGYDPMPANATINFAAIGTKNLSIRAKTSPSPVGSVRFDYDGDVGYHVDNTAPYCIAGSSGGVCHPWTPALGNHTLKATPFTASGAGGTAGTPRSIAFTVQDGTGGGGTGSGLTAQYFDNVNFTALKATRVDATINFDWGSSVPSGSGLTSADTFAVRWTGFVQPQYTGAYTFYTTSDDGVRLWVNGQQLVNNWTNHSATENSGTVTLTAGQKYDVRLEYYDNTGGAVAKLSWSHASQAKQIVPASRLFPATFVGQDVGSVGIAGATAAVNGQYTVNGSGADIWNTADAFHFAHRTLSGDGEIAARVTAVGNTDGWAKAGVMIRESTAPGARHALVALTPGNGVVFQRRSTASGSSNSTSGGSATAPVWVRLVRSGSTLTAYRSADGNTWSTIGSQTISLPNSVLIGLAVTSHNNGSLSTARFDNIRY